MRAFGGSLLLFAAMAVVCSVTASAGCDSATGIGLARIVEIDTRTGPLYGHHTSYQRSAAFLQPKEVVLTFDDGPMPWITRSILDTLDANCTKATFFSVGRMAIAYPQTVKEVLARGHTLGTHTWAHPLNLKRLRPEAAVDEIERGFAAVSMAAGRPIAPFFRFPGLNDNAALLTHLQSRGVATFTVDAISNDSYIKDADKLVAHTLAEVEQRQGGIILFHDIKATTARALPVILSQLKERGYKVVHMRSAATFEPQPQYTAALAPILAKAQPVGKGNLVPFYGAAATLRPGNDTASADVASVPVAAVAPEAKVFVARANESVAPKSPRKPLTRIADAYSANNKPDHPRPATVRHVRPATSYQAPAPQSSGWFGGWTTSVSPPARLRRSSVD